MFAASIRWIKRWKILSTTISEKWDQIYVCFLNRNWIWMVRFSESMEMPKEKEKKALRQEIGAKLYLSNVVAAIYEMEFQTKKWYWKEVKITKEKKLNRIELSACIPRDMHSSVTSPNRSWKQTQSEKPKEKLLAEGNTAKIDWQSREHWTWTVNSKLLRPEL